MQIIKIAADYKINNYQLRRKINEWKLCYKIEDYLLEYQSGFVAWDTFINFLLKMKVVEDYRILTQAGLIDNLFAQRSQASLASLAIKVDMSFYAFGSFYQRLANKRKLKSRYLISMGIGLLLVKLLPSQYDDMVNLIKKQVVLHIDYCEQKSKQIEWGDVSVTNF